MAGVMGAPVQLGEPRPGLARPVATQPPIAPSAAAASALKPVDAKAESIADAKTRLNQFCQKYCSRPVTKTDILYSSTRFGKNEYQAVVRLNCMEGQEYAGEVCDNAKDAEKSAALQAMHAYAAVINSLAEGGKKPKKKQPASGEAGFPPGENPAITDKVKLNALYMKIIKRPLEKGETLYETREMGLGKCPSGFQSTVHFPHLPGEWATKMFAGQVCQQKQAAEQSAAGIALAALLADPEMAAACAAKAPKNQTSDEGKSKSGKKSKGWGPKKTGPHLARESVNETPVSATVVEWKGSYGWVKPVETIDHPAASKHGGKVYLHKQDLKDGKESLEQGSTVLVKIYADASGLGAAE
eukprot:TRINITY_DN89216_c0_g1_i1.p1 TRINITY_DN89216_c0_g1~~TRINITY_DN89216_c0_g1_i1.p1  ORF type:complete len:356 (+),score=90.12 TRINITY_DN89216_c0_g1_i1:45-1112(+)